MFPTKVTQGDIPPSSFGPQTVNKCAFHGPFSAMFLAFLLVTLLFKTVPRCSAHALSCVPAGKRLRCASWGEEVFSELHSGVSYRAAGREFTVGESAMYSE